MNWIRILDKLPRKGQRVLVWIRYEGDRNFIWVDSEIETPGNFSYVEPNSGKVWQMGSAKNYVITHWMKIERP